jgi:Ca-activated chloride channel family protein
MLPPRPPVVQESVIITGRVTEASTSAPLPNAQIRVEGTNFGATSSAQGEYSIRLLGVRGSTVALSATRIGFSPARREVLANRDTVRVDFTLTANTLQLQRVVVAGATDAVAGAKAVFTPGVVQAAGGRAAGGGGRGARTLVIGDASNMPPVSVAAAERLRRLDPEHNTEQYNRIYENPFLGVAGNPLSTFSIDVDRASYGNIRRFISQKSLPPKDAVRVEEMVNYFPYEYPEPRGADPVSITTEIAAAPWKSAHRLVRVGLRGKSIDKSEMAPNNIVFLIDVSGSMQPANKLPLVKEAFRLLVNELREQDRVAIVVYAGAAGLVLPSTSGEDKTKILEAIDRLEAGGSTAGGAGLKLAYDIARENHLRTGNNRVILATDGDFNVGVSSDADMFRLVEDRRGQGTFLTVLGFGMGNYKDSKLEGLADKGNGNYAYIDDLLEAKKMFVSEFGGTMVTIAKDVKLQIEFNPAKVMGYRLIGYENRLLRNEDFKDDTKDAGEIGSGHTVTALYEIIPVGARTDVTIRDVDSLRYQTPAVGPRQSRSDELLTVKLRYKQPNGDTSKEMVHPVLDRDARPSADFTFASAVASFGLLLRDSEYKGTATFASIIADAKRSLGADPAGYRAEFVRMVELAQRLKGDVRPGDDR